VAAGATNKFALTPGHAVRIFTGAPVPVGADTIVIKEKSAVKDNYLFIEDETIKKGAQVRPKGSEINAGDIALPKETTLSPASIGFLAGLGITKASVIPNPSITIIITGDELQQPGTKLEFGQVYESNSLTLVACLENLHFKNISVLRVRDNLKKLIDTVNQALVSSDVVIVTGGVSVGDYDFVLEACNQCGVSKLFHKIFQKPGKPLFFGKKDNKIVFGLPGNPSSVLTCFYEYVLLALELMTKQKVTLAKREAVLVNTFSKKNELVHFLKGYYNGSDVEILTAQESYKLNSFAKANCLVVIPSEVMEYKSSDRVEIHLFPA